VTAAIGILAFLATLGCLLALLRARGVGASGRYYRLQTAASAYAALLVAAGVARTVHPVPQVLVFLLMTFAAARLAVPSFSSGPIHILLTGAAFATIAWAAAIFPDRVHWSGVHGMLVVLGWIVVASAVACGLATAAGLLRNPTGRLSGATAHVFYGALLLWLFVVSVRLALA
jgi:hypothetical protein